MGYKFSLLIPVWYGEEPSKLKRCLDSVMKQTVKPNEIVVVKDGIFSDELNAVLKEYKLKEIEIKESKGIGHALSVGIKSCKYDLIARMDSDDISLPNRFELQLERFAKEKDLAILGGQILEFDKDLEKVRRVPVQYEDILKFSKSRNPFNHMTVMYRKSVILKVGNYLNKPYFEDYYLWIEVLRRGYYVENLDSILVYANFTDRTLGNRGGRKYLGPLISFQKHLLAIKYISYFTFIKNVCERVLVSLMPVKLRGFIYSHFLRKKL